MEVLQKAIQTQQHSTQHLLKLIYNKLLTQQWKARSATHISPTCSYCHRYDETFDHLQKCDNPLSRNYQTNLLTTTISFLRTNHFPTSFRDLFIAALTDWLEDKPPLQTKPTRTSTHDCIYRQTRIGWHLLFKGFASKAWQRQLQRDMYYTQMSKVEQGKKAKYGHQEDNLFAKLISFLWTQQTEFWKQHLESKFTNTTIPARLQPIRLLEYQAKVRILHQRRSDCLPAHRDHYFYTDVESFLQIATIQHLQKYIHNYELAIHTSIKTYRNLPHTNITAFPGFTRSTTSNERHHDLPLSHQARRNLQHHKHTRWKPMTTIKTFFKVS